MASARLLGHLGARRQSDAQYFMLQRHNPQDPYVQISYLRTLCSRQGVYQGWRKLLSSPLSEESPALCRSEWYSLKAYLLGSFRDFELARAAFERAREIAPQDPWPLVEWAHVCELADLYEEALDCGHEALELCPGYHPAILALAHLQTLVGRDEEAMLLLTDAEKKLESGSISALLISLQIEKGMFQEAWETLERCVMRYPFADKDIKKWLAASFVDVALSLHKYDEAKHYAKEVGGEFHERLSDRLSSNNYARNRVLLPVKFVRQHYKTCAPATLTALCHYWSFPVDQMDIVEEICVDGTPSYSERQWAEKKGFFAKEFTVNWDITKQLIDQGLPFTLTTVHTSSAHLQAVIGYDELRGTLLIRDPFQHTYHEFEAESFFAAQKSSGPRGMLLLPKEEAARIDLDALPEYEVWDGYYQFMCMLVEHRREAAGETLTELAAKFPSHTLILKARQTLATYDGDEVRALEVTEQLLEAFPEDSNFILSKATSLALLADYATQLQWLSSFADMSPCDPFIKIQYAYLLSRNGRDLNQAERIIRSTIKWVPTESLAWAIYADILWPRGEKTLAATHYRHATCLGRVNEAYANNYFRAEHLVRRTDIALKFLYERIDQFGAKFHGPIATLFEQLDLLGKSDMAFQMLECSLARFPENTDLILFAAETNIYYRRIDQAKQLLDTYHAPVKRSTWLRLQSKLAFESNDYDKALAHAKEAAELEPLDPSLHRIIAVLLRQHAGSRGAIAYLKEITSRFEHHIGLHELLLQWLSDGHLQESEAVLRHMVAINPAYARIQRELAINLARQNRHEEAWEILKTVETIELEDSSTHSAFGFVLLHGGKVKESMACFRKALSLSIDNTYALAAYVENSTTQDQKREAIDYIYQALTQQVTTGESLLAFQSVAQNSISAEELLSILQKAHKERKDLWQSYAALGSQLIDMGHLDEALDIIQAGITRFSLVPQLHIDAGRIHMLQGRNEEARDCFMLALQIIPENISAVEWYVNSVMRENENYDRALDVLATALARNPENAKLLNQRAMVLWRCENREEAITTLRAAIQIDPSAAWAWDMLSQFASESGEKNLLDDVMNELKQNRPGDIWTWIRRSENHTNSFEALKDIEQAFVLEPHNPVVHIAKLNLLMRLNRLDEASEMLRLLSEKDKPAIGIQFFSARIARAHGDIIQATKLMKTFLEEEPNNYGLWKELAEFCNQEGRYKDYLMAAKNLVRIAPNYSEAHAYLADALLKQSDKNKQQALAIQHFDKAFQLNHSNLFAGLNLIDIYLSENDTEHAQERIETLKKNNPSTLITAREIRLAIIQKNRPEAIARLRELLAHEENHAGAAHVAIEAMRGADWHKILIDEIGNCLASGRCNALAAKYWIQSKRAETYEYEFFSELKRIIPIDSSHIFKLAFLDFIQENKDRTLLDFLLDNFTNEMMADPLCWAQMSYCLVNLGREKTVVALFKDWRQRSDAPYWALDNLCLAYRTLGKHGEAHQIALRSLEIKPDNPIPTVWLAFDAARADEIASLTEHIKNINKDSLTLYYKTMVDVLEAYLLGAHKNDSKLAFEKFITMRNSFKQDIVLRQLALHLKKQLLKHYTPNWLRPYRWLRYAL